MERKIASEVDFVDRLRRWPAFPIEGRTRRKVLRGVVLSLFRQKQCVERKSIMKKKTSYTVRKSSDLQLIEGLLQHLEKSWVPVLAGKKYTRTQMVALLQRRVDAVNA